MSKQTDNKQFWQRWASCYGPLMQSSEPLYAAIAQQMQPHLTPEMNVLELACGSGQLSFRLSRLVRDWEATDFSPKMIAQAKLKPRGAGLHFSVQDATSLPYADETFDAVLIANALHIMPRPEKALAEIYRVLKPGGQLFAPTFVHGEVPRTRLRMLAMRCAGLQIYSSWMVPQYLAFLQAGGAGRGPEAVLDAILQAPRTGFAPAQFARLKKSVRGRLLRELDGFESTCYRICEAIFAGEDCFCDFALLDSITLSDTEAFLTQTITPERAALSVIAPEEA